MKSQRRNGHVAGHHSLRRRLGRLCTDHLVLVLGHGQDRHVLTSRAASEAGNG